jgi:hypothetical protein
MGSRIRSQLSYANVVATLALFLALGGTAFAAVALTKNSVKSRHIGKGQVRAADIGKNAVTSAKVKNRTLLASDFKAGQLSAGPKGDPGEPGVARIAVTILGNGTIFRGSLEGGSARRASEGQYCIDLTFVPMAATVSRSTSVSSPLNRDTLASVAVGPEVTCNPGEELLVTTVEIDEDDNGTIDNTLNDAPFSLLAN